MANEKTPTASSLDTYKAIFPQLSSPIDRQLSIAHIMTASWIASDTLSHIENQEARIQHLLILHANLDRLATALWNEMNTFDRMSGLTLEEILASTEPDPPEHELLRDVWSMVLTWKRGIEQAIFAFAPERVTDLVMLMQRQ